MPAEFRARCKVVTDEKVFAMWEDEIELRERTVMTPAGPMEMVCRGKYAERSAELLAAYSYGRPVNLMASKIDIEVSDVRRMSRSQLEAIVAEESAKDTEH